MVPFWTDPIASMAFHKQERMQWFFDFSVNINFIGKVSLEKRPLKNYSRAIRDRIYQGKNIHHWKHIKMYGEDLGIHQTTKMKKDSTQKNAGIFCYEKIWDRVLVRTNSA